MKESKAFRRLVATTILVLAVGGAVLAFAYLPSIHSESLIHNWQKTQNKLDGIAHCLELYKVLNDNRYPSSLSGIESCLQLNRWSSIDPWGERVKYEAFAADAYSLRSCIKGSKCWRFASNRFKPFHLVNGLEIQSGRWIDPSRLSSPDHVLGVTNHPVDAEFQLEIVVESQIEAETDWRRLLMGSKGYGFSVSAELFGEGQWKVDDTVLTEASGSKIIWFENREAGWDGRRAAKALKNKCSNPKAKLLISVHQNTTFERFIGNNYASIDCSMQAEASQDGSH